jgi:hypothetical protein
MKVNIEHIKYLKSEQRKINKIPLESIKFYEKGKLLKIDKSLVNEFKFTGLANIDFIMTDFYKYGWH